MHSFLGTGVFNSDGTPRFPSVRRSVAYLSLCILRRYVEVSYNTHTRPYDEMSNSPHIRFHRTMTRPFFTRERISHFDIFDAHADDALKQAASRLAEGHPIDFQVCQATLFNEALDSSCNATGSCLTIYARFRNFILIWIRRAITFCGIAISAQFEREEFATVPESPRKCICRGLFGWPSPVGAEDKVWAELAAVGVLGR